MKNYVEFYQNTMKNMKRILSLLLGLVALFGTVNADTKNGCDRYYESAIKFIVDTPVVHPFSINAKGASVIFSSGNLQYCPARSEWRFALRQFDRVGNGKSVYGAYAPANLTAIGVNDNVTTVFYDSIDYSTPDNNSPTGFKMIKGVPCNNLYVSKNYAGWIDLFPWGTSGHGRRVGDEYAQFFYPYELNNTDLGFNPNTYGYGPSFGEGHGAGATSNDIDSKSGANRCFDWGYRNTIREFFDCVYDGNNALLVSAGDSTMYRPGIWRTLSADEWTYILITREVEGKDSAFTYVRLQYGKNNSDTVTGMLIYPDDFSFSEAGVAMLPFGANYAISSLDAPTFEALEDAGVVFLPSVTHYTLTNGVLSIDEGKNGNQTRYWSATAANNMSVSALMCNFAGRGLNTKNDNRRSYGFPVRLAQDYTVSEPPAFSVSATQKVKIALSNIQYQPSTNTWRFATNPYDRCMANNASAAANYEGWIDLFGWGASGVKEDDVKPYSTSVTSTDYSWSEWGNAIGGSWRTPTSEEWTYLLSTRQVNGGAGYSYVTLKYGPADADTATGVLIYPDNFKWADAGLTTPLQVGATAGLQVVQTATWNALSNAGCVFLPGCASRMGTTINPGFYSNYAYYWSATENGTEKADNVYFNIKGKAIEFTNSYRHYGFPVRLIQNL